MKPFRVFQLVFWGILALSSSMTFTGLVDSHSAIEAPTGFDNQSNGLLEQNNFELDRGKYDEHEEVDDGLGPVYNAQACGECHQNPVSGGISQVTEMRAGHFDGVNFIDHPGGSLIHSRAIDAAIQERVLPGNETRTFRTSLNTLGDGFVEAIHDSVFVHIAAHQPAQSMGRIAGEVIRVPILEASGSLRVGRFGWKNQHASLVSFSADAYKNEMGITSPLQPGENTSNGNPVDLFDTVPDPENQDDVEAFSRFMRSTKAPPRDEALAATSDAQAGSQLFDQTGCGICHIRLIITAPAGTLINGGTFTVPPALGNKVIHPFSDFLLHDVGTGDGIVQNGPQSTRNKLRTAPLWGVRTRNRLMHDGESLTFHNAILRHGGEADFVTNRFRDLSNKEKMQIVKFLESL